MVHMNALGNEQSDGFDVNLLHCSNILRGLI